MGLLMLNQFILSDPTIPLPAHQQSSHCSQPVVRECLLLIPQIYFEQILNFIIQSTTSFSIGLSNIHFCEQNLAKFLVTRSCRVKFWKTSRFYLRKLTFNNPECFYNNTGEDKKVFVARNGMDWNAKNYISQPSTFRTASDKRKHQGWKCLVSRLCLSHLYWMQPIKLDHCIPDRGVFASAVMSLDM